MIRIATTATRGRRVGWHRRLQCCKCRERNRRDRLVGLELGAFWGGGEVGRPVPFQRRLAAEGDWRVRGTRAAGAQWPIRRRFVRWGGNFVPCDVVKSNNGPSAIHVDNAGGMLLTTVAMRSSRVHWREGQWRRIHRR